jgi:gliding motility-associated-like protein
LPAGKVVVTVFDNSSPALILRDTFDVPLNAELPTANAGADKDFTCNPPLVQLQGQGSQGANYKYRWRTVDGQLSSNDTTLNAAALAPGSYFLEVTNSETGCTARDTVNVLAVNFPTADAGQNRDFSCTSDTLRLGGAGSTTGAGVRYRWTSTLPSGTFVPGTDTLQNAIVTAPGTYTLAVTNTATGCVDRDSVVIENRQVLPDANAGSDAELPCGAAANVELISRSNNPEAVNVQWLNLNGQILSDSIRFFATAVGDYLLKITNPINNCSKIDTVRVLPSSKSPTVALDSAQLITCLQDTLILNTTVGNTGGFTFQWAAKSGGQFITGTQTTLSPQVARAGIYEITVRDTATSCVTVDSIVIREDKAAPTAEAGRADTITCRVGEVTLNGTGSATGADFTSQWTLNNTVVAADTLRPKVTVPGTYFINVTSKINGCVGRDSVKVDSNLTAPQVRVPIQLPQLTCKDSIITINATANPANPNFTIRWITADSTGIVSGQNTANLRVRTPGIYEIQVTNPANGCVGTNEAVVERDSIKSVSNAGADQKITCTTKTVTLNGNNSSVGSDITYLWRNVSGGQAPSPNNAPQVTVSTPGIYTLLVTNTRNSCTALDSVAVSKNDSLPQLRIARMDSLAITCRDSVARLDASATQPSTVNVQWNGLTGGVPRITPDPLIFEVTQGGNYEVIITRPDNGCVAKDTITVATRDSIPQIRLDSVATLTCTQNTATFDARNTRINGAFSTEWKALSGGSVQTSPNSPLQATATGAGKYQLTVTVTQSGCVATKAIDLKSPEFPIATATTTKPAIGCGENTTLNSAGSTSGAGINYRWAVVSGTGTIANPTAQTVQVDKAGNYQLIVTNSQNGCSDTAVVNITFNVQFALANAGKDTSVCAPNASLTANLPMGTTGTWRSLSNINIGTPTQPTISLSNLTTGSNRFVWALSAPGCGEYSADTVSVKVETAPTATDDAFTLKPGETQGTIVVTSNDNVANIGAFSVAIVENPLRGGISGVGADGKVGYVIKAGLFGEDAFKYKLCSTTCPSFCDSAAVSVTIEEDPNFVAPPTINAITPNGDGLNEQLVFEELLINAAQYPDNELIIFNRWGDIVHTARPYANNWDGTNNTGQPLPEGTYYYILRLNISEGIIIRGDVTIVR